jgi:hypothetical protein
MATLEDLMALQAMSGGTDDAATSYAGFNPYNTGTNLRASPQFAGMQVAQQAMSNPSASPWGILAAALGGGMLGQQQNQYNQQMQEAQKKNTEDVDFLTKLVKEHDEKGLSNEHTINVLMQKAPTVQDPKMKSTYLQYAKMLQAETPKPQDQKKEMLQQLGDLQKIIDTNVTVDPKLVQARDYLASQVGDAYAGLIPQKEQEISPVPKVAAAVGADKTMADPTTGRNEAFLKTLNPDYAPLIQGMSNLDFDSMKRYGSYTGNLQAKLMTALKQYDPKFDAKRFKMATDMLKDYDSMKRGTLGGQVSSLNVLIPHISQLQNDINMMHNGQITPKNVVTNFFKNVTGDSDVTNFRTSQLNANNELETLLSGVGTTQQGMQHRLDVINENASPEQLDGWVSELVKTLEPRWKEMERRWKFVFKGTDKEDPANFIISPENEEIIKRLKGNYEMRYGGEPSQVAEAKPFIINKKTGQKMFLSADGTRWE